MKKLFLIFTLLCAINIEAKAQHDYSLEFDLFTIALGLDDTASAANFFESDSAFASNKWQIFSPEFKQGISNYQYSDCTDSYIAGVKVKELVMEYTWTYVNEDGTTVTGTSVTYVNFKETKNGLMLEEIFNPEGTDAP